MKQQIQALGASFVFFAIGAAFLFLVRGFPYVYDFVSLLGGDVFEVIAAVVLVLGLIVGFQQAMYWFVIRRMEVDRG